MKSETDLSGFVLQSLKMIWGPAAVALRLQQDLGVHSLGETALAAERVGCEVCYVDLPRRVSGLVSEIGGKPHILINRNKSLLHQQYTVPHELGHAVLHLNPSPGLIQSDPPIRGMEECQAHMFAIAWVFQATKGEERKEVLRRNPEASAILFLAIAVTIGVLAMGLIGYLASRLSGPQLPITAEGK